MFVTNKRVAKKNRRQKVFLFIIFFQPICKFSGRSDTLLAAGAKGLMTHSMDQVSEAFMCKKEFSVYFVFKLSLYFLPFLSYDALRICFLTHLVRTLMVFIVLRVLKVLKSLSWIDPRHSDRKINKYRIGIKRL